MKYFAKPVEVEAQQCTKRGYCQMRGWDVPFDEDPDEVGMMVTRSDSGHRTWMTLATFVDLYAPNQKQAESTSMAGLVRTEYNKLSAYLLEQESRTLEKKAPDLPFEELKLLCLEQTLLHELDQILAIRSTWEQQPYL